MPRHHRTSSTIARQRVTRGLVACAVVVAITPTRPGAGVAAASSDDPSVTAAMTMEQRFVQLWNDHKLDQLGEVYYTDDALAVPPNHEPIRGRPAIVEYFRGARDALGELEGGTETFRASAGGDLVSLVGKYSVRSGHVRFTSHELYQRQADGSLRCIVDMFGFLDPLA
jgi:ketosteroid isomerase-like protein